jgi:hypothetical protein
MATRAERFVAAILVQGLNPYVDVPARVSRAFAKWARAGRISVVGRLERAELHATLVPARGGRHRLFLPGGVRAAAGVGVGDRVHIAVRATAPDFVPVPRDLARALRAAGALAAHRALTAAHRRELLRWIDDARTPENRRTRIARTIDHVLGRTPPSGVASAKRRDGAAWICPKCGNELVTRNMNHSCARRDPGTVFAGKPPAVRALFADLRRLIERAGPVKLVGYPDRVGFMARIRFAHAAPRRDAVELAFWLPRRIDSPRLLRVQTIHPAAHAHVLRLRSPADLDDELAGWLGEAHAVGRREHLPASHGERR